MHRANSHPTPASGLGWTSMPAPFEDPNVFFSIGRLQTDPLSAVLRYQIEALSFLKSRCEQDLRYLQEIWSPAHVNDSFDLWCSFWHDAFLDYSKDAGRMADIGSSIAAKAAKRVHGEEKLFADNLAAQTVV